MLWFLSCFLLRKALWSSGINTTPPFGRFVFGFRGENNRSFRAGQDIVAGKCISWNSFGCCGWLVGGLCSAGNWTVQYDSTVVH